MEKNITLRITDINKQDKLRTAVKKNREILEISREENHEVIIPSECWRKLVPW